MKVVLFCGGFGMRLRGYSDSVPKPLVRIGNQPILLHIMKYYASFGHTDFILCLGWKADVIRRYFDSLRTQAEAGGNRSTRQEFDPREICQWNISFADTGLHASIGERLKKLEPVLRDEDCFYANYTDGLCNVDLDQLTEHHRRCNAVASFVSVKPTQSFHIIESTDGGIVTAVNAVGDEDIWMNGGYFTLSGKFFDYLHEGEELVEEPFSRLIKTGALNTFRHTGFWSCMDTYKEMQALEDMHERGESCWQIWKHHHKTVFDWPTSKSIPTTQDG